MPMTVTITQMAMAVRLLGVVGAGNWSEFFRLLGVDSASIGPESRGGGGIDGVGCSSGSETGLQLVGGELASSSFAVRLRCLCHGMLLPIRAHALRAMNMAYGKSEKVPLVSRCSSLSVSLFAVDWRRRVLRAFFPPPLGEFWRAIVGQV